MSENVIQETKKFPSNRQSDPKKIVVTEETPKFLWPLLSYCADTGFSWYSPAPENGKAEDYRNFELVLEFKETDLALCLQYHCGSEDFPRMGSLRYYLLDTSEERPGHEERFDLGLFSKNVRNEFIVVGETGNIVPEIASLVNAVANKSRHKVITSEFWDYLEEMFTYGERSEDGPGELLRAIYLALDVHCWSSTAPSDPIIDDMAGSVRANVLVKLERLGIETYTAQAAAEHILLMMRVYHMSGLQLEYIFRLLMLDQTFGYCSDSRTIISENPDEE